jgi:hypothetical protein
MLSPNLTPRSSAKPDAEQPNTHSGRNSYRRAHGIGKPIAVDVAFFHTVIVADSLSGERAGPLGADSPALKLSRGTSNVAAQLANKLTTDGTRREPEQK